MKKFRCNSQESNWRLHWLYFAVPCNLKICTNLEELYGDLGQWTMTKELAREVSGLYLSSHCEVWWIAESVLNMSRLRAEGTMSSWLLYFRNLQSSIQFLISFGRHYGRNAQAPPQSCPIFLPMVPVTAFSYDNHLLQLPTYHKSIFLQTHNCWYFEDVMSPSIANVSEVHTP